MRDLTALALTYLSAALLYVAVPARLPRRVAASTSARWALAMRIAAATTALAACFTWAGRDGWLVASLVTAASLSASLSAFPLLAPTRPRLAWGLALAAALGAAESLVGAARR
jgi:hypothetical protein